MRSLLPHRPETAIPETVFYSTVWRPVVPVQSRAPGNNECSGAGSCVPHSGSPQVGYCLLSECDATATDTCVALSAACVPLNGEGEVGPAFPVALPMAHSDARIRPSPCSPKTAAKWRTGACAGQTGACDVLDSLASCGAAETCDVLGGIGFGGFSLYCSAQTGNAASGEACGFTNPPYCAPGLTCYGGVCSTYCTPGDPSTCGAGEICADISLSFSLAPGGVRNCQSL